jgi:hypothetical protein
MSIYSAITPSDSTVYAPAIIAIWVTSGGAVAVLGVGDTAAVTIPAVPVAQWVKFPYPVQKIMATNTTATGIIGCATG